MSYPGNKEYLQLNQADFEFKHNREYLRFSRYLDFENQERRQLRLEYYDPIRNIRIENRYDDTVHPMAGKYLPDGAMDEKKYILNLMVRDIELKIDNYIGKEKMVDINIPEAEKGMYSEFLRSMGNDPNHRQYLEPTIEYLKYLSSRGIECHVTTESCFMFKSSENVRVAAECEIFSKERLDEIFEQYDYDRFTYYHTVEVMDYHCSEKQIRVRANFHNLRQKVKYMKEIDGMMYLLREKVKNFSMFDEVEVKPDLGTSIFDFSKRINEMHYGVNALPPNPLVFNNITTL